MEGENLSEIRKTLPDSCKKKSKLQGFFSPLFICWMRKISLILKVTNYPQPKKRCLTANHPGGTLILVVSF